MEGIINLIYGFTGDLGVSIIVLTLGVKLLLMPLSISSKKASLKGQEVSKKMEEVKKRYAKNKRKREEELEKLQMEGASSFKGCLAQFIQLPIISMMYMAVSSLPMEGATMIVPWIKSIKVADQLFIIPIIYILLTIMPMVISKFRGEEEKVSPLINGIMVFVSLIVIIKAPVGLGLYFITSSIFSIVENEIFRRIENKAVCN